MNGWIDTFKATGFEELVDKYRGLIKPKKGRRIDRALSEIQRQRVERLDMVERLRMEAAALFVIEREILAEAENNRTHSEVLCATT